MKKESSHPHHRSGRLALLLICLLAAMLCMTVPAAGVFASPAGRTTYKIIYAANGGTHAPKKQTQKSVKKKLTLRVSNLKPIRTGYDFAGWNTKKNGSGKAYAPGSKITLRKNARQIKLFAAWARKTTAVPAAVPASAPGNGTGQDTQDDDDAGPEPGSHLEVHFIDVGQGDATLIMCDGEAMLIDAGDNSKGTAIQSYLMSKKVSTLKHLVGTHPDADHIGGLDVVITKFNVQNLFMPPYGKDTRTYDDVIQAAWYKNLKITNPPSGSSYKLGGAEFQIVSTGYDYGDSANDWSICIRLVHGNNSFLFVGDAEEAAETDMLNMPYTLESDVYKVAHHGSSTGSIESFMKAVSPQYAVISCGKDNPYGHPHAEVMNRLRSMRVPVFRTDEQGTVIASSDGKTISWSTSPTSSWTQGEPSGSSRTAEYVLNTKSMVYHLPSCSGVKQMSEKNKKSVSAASEDLELQGYRPCGMCCKNS